MTKLAALFPPPGSNKYELAIVAAREARRLNEWSKRTGDTLPGKGDGVGARSACCAARCRSATRKFSQ